MDIFSTDPDRPGIFAVGQIAYGVFALGQMATGVIAVGQVARGVIAVGQGAVGFVAIGQGAIGVVYGGGMLAVAGRGFGICLKMLPKLIFERYRRPTDLGETHPLRTFQSGARERGKLVVTLDSPELAQLELAAEITRELDEARRAEHTHACLEVQTERRVADGEVGYRQPAAREHIVKATKARTWREATPRLEMDPGALTGIGGLFLRAIGMIALVVAWFLLAGQDIMRLFA